MVNFWRGVNRIIREIKREVNKINFIVDEIIKDMPNNYRKEIKKELKI